MDRKVVHKLFWDFEEEEGWLNEMAADGWSLVAYSWVTYTFHRTEPGEWIYRIELLPDAASKPASREYLRFMTEAGVETAATYFRWVYFRKPASEGPFELYSDLDSRLAHYRRVLALYSSLTAALLPLTTVGVINLSRSGRAMPFVLPLSFLQFIIVAVFANQVVRLSRRIKSLTAEQRLFE